MKLYEIPLTPISQRFTINLNGRQVAMTIRWKETSTGRWSMDLDDLVTDKPLVHGIPMVTGADLLDPYKHLGIPCGLVMIGPDMKEATRDNLGVEVRLYMVTEEA